jgi:hypothetical protein
MATSDFLCNSQADRRASHRRTNKSNRLTYFPASAERELFIDDPIVIYCAIIYFYLFTDLFSLLMGTFAASQSFILFECPFWPPHSASI